MSKREIVEITVSGNVLKQVNNITVNNAAFSTQLTKYLNAWIAIGLEKYQELHGPVKSSELYQTYADTQAPAKGGRKIQQTKKDKKDNTEKQVDVSPKAYFTSLGNLKIFLNYFLIKYALELRHIFITNDYDFDRNYNESELEKDAMELILNPLIPFVLHVAKQFDANKCNYNVTFEGMTAVKQIFKTPDNGQASTKKIEQFMLKFFDFVNVFITQIFSISYPRKSLLHLDYIIGLLDVFNATADINALGEDVLQDLHHYLRSVIKKPVKTGKKSGAANKKETATQDNTDNNDDDNDDNNDDDDIEEQADYGDI